MSTIAIIDYGMGNLHSIAKAVEHVAPADTRVLISSEPDKILSADRVVFPGLVQLGRPGREKVELPGWRATLDELVDRMRR